MMKAFGVNIRLDTDAIHASVRESLKDVEASLRDLHIAYEDHPQSASNDSEDDGMRDVLAALERGEISVDEAMSRLDALD